MPRDGILENAGGIRRFDDAAIQEAIDAALANVPAGKRGAVVAYVDHRGDARLAAAARIGEHWSVVGVLSHQPSNGKVDGAAAIRMVW